MQFEQSMKEFSRLAVISIYANNKKSSYPLLQNV